ncbi:MAG TPA: hypothetical protein VGQ82_07680 [Chthoniobacterales bacterium]|nr:hypothetical protein [Chthoniobacterales bacterium]
MRKLMSCLCAAIALTGTAVAGPEHYSGKEMKQTAAAPSCPQWYADNEWNVSLWGTYAFTGNNYREDRYLDVDHAWGGGVDAKYFFARYFGLGVEGYVLDANNNGGDRFNTFRNDGSSRRAIGSVLGTFTLRYPIPCTRFAPYVYTGGGGIFGGGVSSETVIDPTTGDAFRQDIRASNSKLVGQFGGGLEVRVTPHIGIIQDFSWNVVDGPNNNFGMARAGVNFAF